MQTKYQITTEFTSVSNGPCRTEETNCYENPFETLEAAEQQFADWSKRPEAGCVAMRLEKFTTDDEGDVTDETLREWKA